MFARRMQAARAIQPLSTAALRNAGAQRIAINSIEQRVHAEPRYTPHAIQTPAQHVHQFLTALDAAAMDVTTRFHHQTADSVRIGVTSVLHYQALPPLFDSVGSPVVRDLSKKLVQRVRDGAIGWPQRGMTPSRWRTSAPRPCSGLRGPTIPRSTTSARMAATR